MRLSEFLYYISVFSSHTFVCIRIFSNRRDYCLNRRHGTSGGSGCGRDVISSLSLPLTMNCLRRPNILAPVRRRTFCYLPSRLFHSSTRWRSLGDHDRGRGLTNILADDNPPAVQVKRITNQGIQLVDGLVLPSACIFLEGQVFLWDVPQTLWEGWGKEHLEIFDLVSPRPGPFYILFSGLRMLISNRNFTSRYGRAIGAATAICSDIHEPTRRPSGYDGYRASATSLENPRSDPLSLQKNACSTYNVLAEEGRRVAAALLPISPHLWQKTFVPSK